MKKVIIALMMSTSFMYGALENTADTLCQPVTMAFSSGYVLKHDCVFNQVYGPGIVNILTANVCYPVAHSWALASTLGFWYTHGETTLLGQKTHLRQIPWTFSFRKTADLSCKSQVYAALGGGVIWTRETSCTTTMTKTSGTGEFEVGFARCLFTSASLIGAFRYLFPRTCIRGYTKDLGGFDLRAGFQISL